MAATLNDPELDPAQKQKLKRETDKITDETQKNLEKEIKKVVQKGVSGDDVARTIGQTQKALKDLEKEVPRTKKLLDKNMEKLESGGTGSGETESSSVASKLRQIADRIDASEKPDRALVTRAIRIVIGSLRTAKNVNLTFIKETASPMGGLAFMVKGKVDGEQFEALIGLSTDDRSWDVEKGRLPEGSDEDFAGKFFSNYEVQEAIRREMLVEQWP